MADKPIDLDAHRCTVAQQAIEVRRKRRHEFHVDQAALLRRQQELDRLLMSVPARTWSEAASRAQYLIELFSATAEAQEPGRKALIALVLEDLNRLCDLAQEPK